ncbi:phosphatase PAP2 family protein [Candidatus Uhrbacteria bacterium]|jgi:undecaprenyl-diphosphatase|nr:phosphatase PAP2 family protein [Candidatus Uhrbacteria bacterium]MBT7717695.1 phosphatase PAP2 family protein [Candidatus Uhrbacteria bacterium]
MKWDERVSSKIQNAFHPEYSFWSHISELGLYLYGLIMIGLLFVVNDTSKVFFWVSPVIIATGLSLLLQFLIKRHRPPEDKTMYHLAIKTYSFPSVHAAASFSFATVLSYAFCNSSLEHAWAFVIAFYLLALYIAWSRIVVGVHYFLDVLAGSLLGVLISVAFFYLS